jgi:DNA-directed RNA polymerase subunit F
MVINEEKPITIAEVNSLVGEGEKAQEIKNFIKNFKVVSLEDSNKMREELSGLGNLKLKDAHIVKIIDFVPKTVEELNKILSDVSLDKEETEKILNVTKNY